MAIPSVYLYVRTEPLYFDGLTIGLYNIAILLYNIAFNGGS